MKHKFSKGNKINLGRKLTKEHKRKISEANKDKIVSEETREKLRKGRLGKYHTKESKIKIGLAQLGEKSHNWKGDKAGERALHRWIRKYKLKFELCEECYKMKKLELANIKNHQYSRNPDDYKWLCKSCHTKYDFKLGLRKVDDITRLNMSFAHIK
jgi:hypothetical protein